MYPSGTVEAPSSEVFVGIACLPYWKVSERFGREAVVAVIMAVTAVVMVGGWWWWQWLVDGGVAAAASE